MTAHDPALIDRLAKACHPWVTFTASDGDPSITSLDDQEIAERALDLLAAEGRLCEPSPELHSAADSPHVAAEVKPTDDQGQPLLVSGPPIPAEDA